MAKKTFNNLKPTNKKLTDSKIDDVLANLDKEKTSTRSSTKSIKPKKHKLIPLPVKLPEKYYNALKAESQDKGLSMKHIIIEALNERLKERL